MIFPGCRLAGRFVRPRAKRAGQTIREVDDIAVQSDAEQYTRDTLMVSVKGELSRFRTRKKSLVEKRGLIRYASYYRCAVFVAMLHRGDLSRGCDDSLGDG